MSARYDLLGQSLSEYAALVLNAVLNLVGLFMSNGANQPMPLFCFTKASL